MPTQPETTQQYVRRILSNVEGKDPMEVLRKTPSRLRSVVRDAPADALRRRPAPDKWSPTEIIAHLADSEIVTSYRIRQILAHDGVAIQAFDQDEWATGLLYEAADPVESVELFEATRAANLRLLDRVDRRRLEHHGMHSERGRETVTHLIRLYAGHDLNHLGQIDRILAPAQASVS